MSLVELHKKLPLYRFSIGTLVFLVFFIFITTPAIAQQTVIKGKVSDASTFEPVAFVDVYFKNTSIGCRTGFDGRFEISTNTPLDSLTVRFLGYISLTKPIIKGDTQIVDFQLAPSALSLNELVILPGENPAVTLLKKVWAKKDSNNMANLTACQYERYSITQVYLRKLFESSKDTVLTKNSQDTAVESFSLEKQEAHISATPVYVNEAVADVFFIKSPLREKVLVKGSSTKSLANIETEMVSQLIQKSIMYNFNDNYIIILDKNFISPISSGGLFYYKYYLTDSMYIDGKYCYEIQVKAKRKEDLAFNGYIWINDTTFALKRISVELGKEANINFVKRIKIQQDLVPTTENAWIPQKTRIMADAVNIFISAYSANSNIVVNHPKILSFYDKEIEISDTAYDLSEQNWKLYRPGSLANTDSLAIHKIDSLKKRFSVKLLTALVNMSIKGYVNLGKIELGPYLYVYRHNEIEGNRFRLGFLTNSSFSKQWIFKGYVAYGTTDNKIKYNGQMEKFLSRKSWSKAGVQYSEDIENLGAVDEFYNNSSFTSLASSFGGSDKLNQIKLGRCWVESDIFRGFTQKVIFLNKQISPLSKDYYFAYFTDAEKINTRSDITLSEITFLSIYQPKATFIVDKNNRFPVVLKKAPVFTFNYTLGIKNILQSRFSYHKASLEIKHNISLGGWGSFIYDMQLSKVFSPLPYPMLDFLAGNESIFRSDRMYNLMNYGEFVADQTAELYCTYHMEGLIFDKFPLLKKLGFRSVASAHLAYGSFDEKKNGTYSSSNPTGILPVCNISGDTLTGFNTFIKDKPYIEISYGVENIFRFFRIDAIHRLTYLNNTDARKFGIKISAAFRF
ncbi:MAG: DUF5686 family protein [Bacteroidota bacterium]